jgi:crossover junction endodeoxyribonuclease RuvC
VRGVVLLAAERAGVEIAEYAPRFIKQTVVGYGAAEKQQVQEMMRVLLRLKDAPTPFDASDALAVAVTHLHQGARPEQTKSKAAPARAKLEALLAANPRRRAPR